MSSETQPKSKTVLVKPKTKAGKRALEKRAPKLVEDPRKALFLYGNKASQLVKEAMMDLQRLKGTDSLKFTKKNSEVRPFETGGEVQLEIHSRRSNCSLFALGSHSKKRPHNLTLGRMYDFRLYDAVELGIVGYKAIKAFPASSLVQYGNKPAFVFVGDSFDSDPVLRQVRSLFLDFFRGIQVDNINLKGLDRVIFMTHLPCGQPGAPGLSHKVLFRQYAVRFKKSGTRIPRAELYEMGPSLDFEVRRRHQAAPDLEKEAITRPKIAPKKEKNVGSDTLDGKIGRIYMPKQDVGGMALHKMKGLKRERREAKAKSGESSKILSKKAKSDTAADD